MAGTGKQKLTVYISGPITGLPKDAAEAAFHTAKRDIRGMFSKTPGAKIKILNPVKIGKRLEKEFAKNGKKPEWADYMRACLPAVCGADFLYLLPGWAASKGAQAEVYAAELLGIPAAHTVGVLSGLITEAMLKALEENKK